VRWLCYDTVQPACPGNRSHSRTGSSEIHNLMSEEQPRHPLSESSNDERREHPLNQIPKSQQPRQRGIRVQFPGTATRPYLTYALIIINVAIFLLRYVQPQIAYDMLVWGVADTERIVNPATREIYRLFTAMFLHLNEAHILFNSLALFYIGSNVERLFGHVRYALIYFLGGLAGSIAMLFVGLGGLGASGAVFAIWGAEVVFFYKHRALFGAVAQARLRSSLIYMGLNFFLGFAVNAAAEISNAENAVRIGNAAHFGGLVGGALLTWLIQPHFTTERVQNPQPGQAPIRIVQTNKLTDRVRDILFYCVGLAGLLLLAILLA